MCPFQVKARRQSNTAIWTLKQDSLNLAHTCGLIFGNRKAPKHPVHSMSYLQIGLYIPVTGKTGGSTKHLQKTACVQAGIHMKPSQAFSCCQDKQSDDVVQQLGQYQLLQCYTDILKQDDLTGIFMFESVQGISGHNNKPYSQVFKQLYVVSSATKKAWEGALQIMVVEGTFLKGHIFDQVVLLAVTYDGNNNQVLLSYAVVTSETEDNWVCLVVSWSKTSQGHMSLLQTTLRALRFTGSSVVTEALEACLQCA